MTTKTNQRSPSGGDRAHRCTDLDLILPIRQGYRSLQATSRVLGVDYNVLRRVVHGQRCTEEEEARVRQAWARYSPESILELAELVADRSTGTAYTYAKQLRDAVERVLWIVEGDS